MDPLEPEPVADALHLLDEGLDRPERRVVRPRGLAAAELVEEDDAPPLLASGASASAARASRRGRRAGEQRQPPRFLAVAEDEVGRLPVAERESGAQPIVQVSPAWSSSPRSPSPCSRVARRELLGHQLVVDRALDVAEDADRRRAVRRVREPRQREREARRLVVLVVDEQRRPRLAPSTSSHEPSARMPHAALALRAEADRLAVLEADPVLLLLATASKAPSLKTLQFW